MSQNVFLELRDSVINGEAEHARDLTERSLAANISPEQLLDEGLIPAMTEAGQRFEARQSHDMASY